MENTDSINREIDDNQTSNGHELPNVDHSKAVPIVGFDGKIIGFLANPAICASWGQLESHTELFSERVFPCRSNAEVRIALATTLRRPHIEIEVAGGIVRHDYRW